MTIQIITGYKARLDSALQTFKNTSVKDEAGIKQAWKTLQIARENYRLAKKYL